MQQRRSEVLKSTHADSLTNLKCSHTLFEQSKSEENTSLKTIIWPNPIQSMDESHPCPTLGWVWPTASASCRSISMDQVIQGSMIKCSAWTSQRRVTHRFWR